MRISLLRGNDFLFFRCPLKAHDFAPIANDKV